MNTKKVPSREFILFFLFLMGCLRQDDLSAPEMYCVDELSPNISLMEVLDSFDGSTREIRNDWVVEAYVISSDKSGNFYNTLHLQDRPAAPQVGVQVELELRNSHLFYPVGQKVLLKLKGLFIGRSKGIFKLGNAYTSFGNVQVGRIPKHAIVDHVLKMCGPPHALIPTRLFVQDLIAQPSNTLVELKEMEFMLELKDSTYAQIEVETVRTMQDCDDREIGLLNSGYSDFQKETLPTGKGSITAIYYPEGGKPQLMIRSPEDLDLRGERCEDLITEFTSESLIISELADPDNNSAARYVELHYSGSETLSLNGWRLDRYTNDNTERGSTIDLSALTLFPGQFLLIASDAAVFEQTYGFAPDLQGGTNSPADSNGDDNLVLIDPFGSVIDIFGVVGEDGSGTSHEFEDGRAYRKEGIQLGNPVFDPSEWEVFNDTGGSGTTNQPQQAPGDFTPGSRD
ncbi:DUF5689 domain-containing protein [Muriicola sp.]|uniref:DUF5689 domain-containing protein n=1 Tax=Muriicola sp. TaxID=2020856 RepID=UPI0035656543